MTSAAQNFAPPFKRVNMKKFNLSRNFYVTAFAAMLLLALLFFASAFGSFKTASASDQSSEYYYGFYYENFAVSYDISSDRKLSVREELTVHFTRRSSTGFIRDIPSNGGELIRNVSVIEKSGSTEISVPYSVENYQDDYNNSYISVDIGDGSNKTGKSFTYILTYDYCLTKAQEGANNLAINVIGPQDRRVERFSAELILPDGFLSGTFSRGQVGSSDKTPLQATTENGKKVIKIAPLELEHFEGVTVNLTFDDGALSTYFDFTPYIFVIAAAVAFLCMVAVKLLCFNKRNLTPVVNFEAPEKMNPLMMGKLIDNAVDTEDITSMIFYWADNGYLKINVENEDNPLLIRIVQELPEGTPAYEKRLFSDLFAGNDTVTPGSVPAKYYNTVQAATSVVNARAKNLYEKPSIGASYAFTAIFALILALAPTLIGLFQINSSYFSFIPFAIAILPFPFVHIFGTSIAYNKLKTSKLAKQQRWIKIGIIAGISLFATFLYALTVPSAVMGVMPRILLVLETCAAAAFAPMLIQRTEKYNAQLNEITGFKNFIELAEKDRLEKMIESDPQFYYHVLPYAQVLGVSDKWEEKFESIALPPPAYITYSGTYTLLEFHMMNRMLRNSVSSFSARMSPPASSSAGGSGRGGFGGFHVGGGHGGGGSRGR